MGHLFEVMNNYEDARLHYMDAYRLYRRAEDKHGMALASENLGRLEYRVRMFAQAVQNLEEARRLYISVGDRIELQQLIQISSLPRRVWITEPQTTTNKVVVNETRRWRSPKKSSIAGKMAIT